MRLRRATLADLEDVLAVINDPASPHNQQACAHRAAPEAVSQLYDRLREDESLLIEEGGLVLAFASWQLFEDHAHLNVLSVAGGQQRRGLGRQLFEAFKAALREDGVRSYTLRAYADSPWAISFYAGQGLTPWKASDTPRHAGLLRYIRLATAQGDWPRMDKVLFFEAL